MARFVGKRIKSDRHSYALKTQEKAQSTKPERTLDKGGRDGGSVTLRDSRVSVRAAAPASAHKTNAYSDRIVRKGYIENKYSKAFTII
jgi:hypothetical protein